ncbi:2-polyprenyl-6-methoxyphenol hydroxylase [Amycolatopsis xylanica]|uniref:2-polyprenyl-6-methoxyphenol hydroxylase n=1 Tax=Amycolatopsis xylanica TaxID=589385 RepID=A0A1H2SDB9_9PSEU|nr:2-polyprenyl-6-methoxyphenol hydroxylase [Amycolatopsis xylanica]
MLIVGGGPVGLTARALLRRWNVRTLLIEKHAELSPFPRSRLVNVRSMEIFRELDLAAEITARAFAPSYGRVRFRDTLRDDDFASAALVGVHDPVPESPEVGVVTSQDRLEPILLAAADSETWFGAELVDLAEDDDGVAATVVSDGGETRIRARYVLAADGANSTVRQRLGIGLSGPGKLAALTTIVFDAELDQVTAQPAGVYFTSHGTFLPLYPEGGWAMLAATPEDPETTDWAALVAQAIGAGGAVKVARVQHWVMNAAIADRFRHGRILLAGDAAHALPILGGMGMNTGIADVHNLCWKLAGVLQGWDEPSLLETYEAERHPIAQQTLTQTVANTQLALGVQARRRAGETPAGTVELPWSDRYFAQLGLVLGASYGEASEPPGTDYVPNPSPGHRLPHAWLADGRSTLDSCGATFALLTPDPARWRDQRAGAWPLQVETLPRALAGQFGLGPHDALLVRPDSHIDSRLTG